MKTFLLRGCVVVSVGSALLLGTVSMRADDPAPKTPTTAEASHDHHSKSAKDGGKAIPTVDGRHSTSAKSGDVGGADGRETRVPTGSHLPKTYTRKGYTSNLDQNTTIIDKSDIRLQNSNTVGDALRQVPGLTVGGSR